LKTNSLQELPDRVDLAVIGDGPSNSTLASLVARVEFDGAV